MSPLLMASIETMEDLAKRELAGTGRVSPKALFVYDGPRTTVVSLSWRDEVGKDALLRRIRDKALKEDARAVVIAGVPLSGKGRLLTLSGMTPETELTALVDFAFDTATHTIGRWELRWVRALPGDAFQGSLLD